MKKILFLLLLAVLSCSRNSEDSTSSSGSSPYSFNFSFNGETSSIKGTISPTDYPQSIMIPAVNGCFSQLPGYVQCWLLDITKKDYVSGVPNNLWIWFDPSKTGTGITGSIHGVELFSETLPKTQFDIKGTELTKLKITDLGTPTTSTASSTKWGNPVRGSYDETVYIWDYKTNKPVAKRLTFDFVAVREF